MNTSEKNTLIQELSLLLFAKYEPANLRKKLESYSIKTNQDRLKKRAYLTKTLRNQSNDMLQQIAEKEQFKPSSKTDFSPYILSSDTTKNTKKEEKKIFISHSSEDIEIVQVLIAILEDIGIDINKIYCSSFEAYNNKIGEDYEKRLKTELNSNTLVLFVLSKHFFQSQMCLCELGAVWILSQDQIPIYIPPFCPEDAQGVLQKIQGIYINNRLQITKLKQQLEGEFEVSKYDEVNWAQRLEKSLKEINNYINNHPQ